MAKRYFPPISALFEAIGTTPEALNKPGHISVPSALLRHLIAAAVSDLEIDEDVYKEQNPDIAKAYARRPSSEVAVHYRTVGYFEQRPLPIKFDENYYTRRYPDVSWAVKAKLVASPLQHFNATGAYELRCPRADLESVTEEWRQTLAESRKKP
jgi:hypothetical protein